MTAVDVQVLDELGELIEDLTTTGRPSLDEKQIKRVKNICKTSNSYVNHAYHILVTQLKKKHSEIRFSCFQIIQELFSRSHAFRELVLGEFQVFMELVIGTDSSVPLPPPLKTARSLREKAIEAVEKWHQKYGSHYKKLDLGYHYLKRIKHIEFDAIRTRSLAERRHAEEREQRRQRIRQKKIDKVENEMAEQTGHIELCLTEINNCFKLLLPHPDDYEVHCLEVEKQDRSHKPTSSNDLNTEATDHKKEEASTNHDSNNDNECDCTDQDNDESQSEDLVKDHGLGSRSYEINLEVNNFQPSVNETEDNTIILNTAREMNKEMTHKYLPMVNQWLQVLTKAGHTHQRILSIIHLKGQLQSAKDKFNELNISPIKLENDQEVNNGNDDDDDEEEEEKSDDDEDEFFDVPEKEGVEYIPESKMAEYGLESVLQKGSSTNVSSSKEDPHKDDESFLKQYGFSLKDADDPTSHARALLEARRKLKFDSKLDNQAATSTLTSQKQAPESSLKVDCEKRKKLLEKAPMVPFDMDLYHWEDPNYDPPKIIRSDNFNNYWASNDMDPEQLFEDDKGSMLNRRITFAGKFEPVKWACHAPLPNGKLCPRRDRVKCPFHGVIVARDDKGNPVGERSIDTSAPSTSASLSQDTSTTAEDWRDIQKDIEAATGLDLGKNVKKRKAHKRKSKNSEEELSRKEKYSRLTDIHKSTKTPRSRLERKVLSRDSMKRVAEEMDSLATKKFLDKFGDQFNYQLKK